MLRKERLLADTNLSCAATHLSLGYVRKELLVREGFRHPVNL